MYEEMAVRLELMGVSNAESKTEYFYTFAVIVKNIDVLKNGNNPN